MSARNKKILRANRRNRSLRNKKRNSRRNQSIKKQKRTAFFILFGIILGAALVGIYIVLHPSVRLDPETYCKLDEPLSESYVVLIDTSDKLPNKYVVKTKAIINKLQKKLAVGTKLTLLTLSGNTDDPVNVVFSLCNPGRGNQFSQLTSSIKKMNYRWKKNFGGPLERLLKNMEALPEASETPLFEAFQAINAREDFSPGVQKRHLIIVSDMMAFTKDFSQYRRGKTFGNVEKLDYFKNFDFNFRGADVTIIYVKRKKLVRLQGSSHQQFWQSFFMSEGSTRVDYE